MQIYNSLDEVIEAGSIAPDSIINADCLEAMKFIPDKSIDAIITDLPYSITNCHWDKLIPFDLLWEQYKRIIKPNGAIVLFGSQPFTSALVMSNPKWFKYEWIWNKVTARGHLVAKIRPLAQHENIIVFCKEKANYFPQMVDRPLAKIAFKKECARSAIMGGKKGSFKGRVYDQWYPKSILERSNANSSSIDLHPTQKPVPLIEYLIKTYTLEDEIILDNTAGSGTRSPASTPTAATSA